MEVGRTSIKVKLGTVALAPLTTFEMEAASEAKSAAWNSVSPEVSSINLVQLWVGGGECGGETEGMASVSNRREPSHRSAEPYDGDGVGEKREERWLRAIPLVPTSCGVCWLVERSLRGAYDGGEVGLGIQRRLTHVGEEACVRVLT